MLLPDTKKLFMWLGGSVLGILIFPQAAPVAALIWIVAPLVWYTRRAQHNLSRLYRR